MPTNYSGLEIDTPQDVLERLRNKRTEMLATNNPLLMQRATIEEGFQAAFGSPEERRAIRVQKAVAAANKSVQPAEGEDDVTQSLRKLAAMRDAVADIDPSVADKITTEMLKLGTIRLERQKLQGDITRTAGQEQRERDLHPSAIAEAGIDVVQKASEMESWINTKTGEYQAVGAGDYEGKVDLAKRGFVPGGRPTLQGGKNEMLGIDTSPLTKPSMNDAQAAYMKATASLDMLAQTMQKYDPAFSTLPMQLLSAGQGVYEKLGGKLTPAQKEQHGRYTAWQRNTIDGLNRYINMITGAQMAVEEAKRIMKAYPKPADGPTEYINNVREVTKQLLQVQKRNANLLAQGIKLEGDQFLNVPLPDVTEAEVDAYMAKTYGITAPGAATGGETSEQQKARIRATLKSNP